MDSPICLQAYLITTTHVDNIVNFYSHQTSKTLKVMVHMSKSEEDSCKERSDAAPQPLKASGYNLDVALQAILTVIERRRKSIHVAQMKFAELCKTLLIHLFVGIPDKLVPEVIRAQRKPFGQPLPQGDPIQDTSNWHRTTEVQETQESQMGSEPDGGKEGMMSGLQQNQEDFGIVVCMNFFEHLSQWKKILLANKLNDTKYTSCIVNLSKCKLSQSEQSFLPKGCGICPITGVKNIGNIFKDLEDFKRKAKLHLFF